MAQPTSRAPRIIAVVRICPCCLVEFKDDGKESFRKSGDSLVYCSDLCVTSTPIGIPSSAPGRLRQFASAATAASRFVSSPLCQMLVRECKPDNYSDICRLTAYRSTRTVTSRPLLLYVARWMEKHECLSTRQCQVVKWLRWLFRYLQRYSPHCHFLYLACCY